MGQSESHKLERVQRIYERAREGFSCSEKGLKKWTNNK